MSTNCLEFFSACIAPRTSKVLASAWPLCNASCKSTEAECGRRGNLARERFFISPSVPVRKRKRKAKKPRLEAGYERRRTRHTLGGRQSGRYGSCPARTAAGQTGERHLCCSRWRGGAGLSVLSGSVRATIV